jgi:TPR repeat protein
LALGAKSDEPYAKYSYAYYLFKEADTDEKKVQALSLLKLAGEKGESNACTYLSYCYQYGFHLEQSDIEQSKTERQRKRLRSTCAEAPCWAMS